MYIKGAVVDGNHVKGSRYYLPASLFKVAYKSNVMDNNEIWKDIPGFVGIYKVSSLCGLKSIPRHIKYKDGRSFFTDGKRLSVWIGNHGYYCAALRKEGKTHRVLLHRLVAMAFIPNPENKRCINHIDGNKTNNSISNLEWCTHSENLFHGYKIGLTPKGEDHHNSKLTDAQVLEIRGAIKMGITQRNLATEYRVCQKVIWSIATRKSWKHI